MPATTSVAATAAPATSIPRQGDLLAALNSTSTPPTARKQAKQLLKLWYPMAWAVWSGHNA